MKAVTFIRTRYAMALLQETTAKINITRRNNPMSDSTESTRRKMVNEINNNPQSREALAALYGPVWDTEELSRDFEVKAFMAPLVVVTRKADRAEGSLIFQGSPRLYYSFIQYVKD
jgi:hypothetical protein